MGSIRTSNMLFRIVCGWFFLIFQKCRICSKKTTASAGCAARKVQMETIFATIRHTSSMKLNGWILKFCPPMMNNKISTIQTKYYSNGLVLKSSTKKSCLNREKSFIRSLKSNKKYLFSISYVLSLKDSLRTRKLSQIQFKQLFPP